MDRRSFMVALGAATLMSPGAMAQSYPTRPIRLVVAFAAGGPADIFARVLANGMSTALGQQVVIENRTGTAGLLGVDTVAKSEPDGYSLCLVGAAALSTVPFMVPKMPFDWEKDLALLTLVSRVPEVMTVRTTLGINSVAELVAYAKANPGKINFGSAGVGSITHLAGELFKTEAKVDIVHVPYRGAALAVNDLLAGHIDMMTADMPVLLPQIQAGAIKALAVTTQNRVKALSAVPTTAEVGYPMVISDNWYGLVGPAQMPTEIKNKISEAALASLRASELVKQFESQEAIPSPTSAADFIAFVKSERAKWGPLIASTGIKLE
ncbi:MULTISPECIES: tripartite tricarboxylate transporter substrate binding protein [unclassified Beijerinckia]|uniref:Bug family tripartite tricarboxylate transporter substrate binding protein n=1 Tax=unclassified Beijerinckia TaxID=2638183 RepID=UPI000895D64D|nr:MULTISPECIES: tripartite tricarboxylate transporter substrate binding protein [unclassified Beijerinckia]MDH7797086.1 tripartite-type tricarboxylate transporter receptor subunit TctC [Beijerinckia sp. GAS462]SEC71676.1 Tripartite-type tricarboxylate transporter, receptor component TctC [Beijerinckia sp. 28-YEA-48]